MKINLIALNKYQAKYYHQKVILLRAKNKMLFKGHTNDWQWSDVTVAENFSVEYLPGNHQTIMRPHNAQAIAQVLEEASACSLINTSNIGIFTGP
jgi:thioesterase domain-containing protein